MNTPKKSTDFKKLGINPLPAGSLGDPLKTWNPADPNSKPPGFDPLEDNSFLSQLEEEANPITKLPNAPKVRPSVGTPVYPTQEPVQPEPESEQQGATQNAPNMIEFISSMKDGPSRSQIDAWKSEFPEVSSAFFAEDEVYVIRPLLRQEWRQLNSDEKVAQNFERLKEQVVFKCVLWPRKAPEQLAGQKAGTLDTLYEQIMALSNFIPPDVAIQLVARL